MQVFMRLRLCAASFVVLKVLGIWFWLSAGSVAAWAQVPATSPQATSPALLTQTPSLLTLPSLFERSRLLSLPEPMGVLAVPVGSIKSPEELLKAPHARAFKAWHKGMELPTSNERDVWLRLVLPSTALPEAWMFRIPRLTLEKVTLYQAAPASTGAVNSIVGWSASTAGLALPKTQWPMLTRDPVFQVTTRSEQTQLFFIRIEHRFPVTENPQLIYAGDFGDGANRVGTLNGLLIGLFMVLTCICLISGRINGSSHFYWFALFSFSVMLAQLALSGYLSVRIWPGSVYMARVASWVFPLLSLAALARLCLSIGYARDLSRPIFMSLWGLILVSLGVAALVLLKPQGLPNAPLNIFFGLGMLGIVVSMAWLAWRSQYWLWPIVASLVPIILSGFARLAYNQGWVAHAELAQLAGVITVCIGLLVIYATLVLHNRNRLRLALRQEAVEMTDAASGLFNERIAQERLPQVILRSQRFQKSCGVIMVRWVDYEHLMPDANTIIRNQIMAHLGARLQRVSRDIDTVARIGTDLFLYLIEAPVTREILNDLGSQILTTCMRSTNYFVDNKGYDVHIAIWQSGSPAAEADQVIEMLRTRIDQMSHGTKRRLQFVDAPLSTSSGNETILGPEQAQALVEKINSLEATQGLPTIDNRRARAEGRSRLTGQLEP
jgi:GGDEF domain-containing protein